MNTELTAKQIARIERIRAERAERIVDQRDSPNIFPYKKCGFCYERSSCGNYTDDDVWQCESCAPEEEECICESDKKPNPLCPDHQCCWACSTQSVPIALTEDVRLWLCDECNDLGDWCRGCHKLIDKNGYCSFGCDYYMWEGVWECSGCLTWREDEKYCADCGPGPLDVESDEEEKREREKESI